MNKEHQFLAYLTSKHQSASVTVLMKLSYLVDLISIKKRKEKISSFEYIRYQYGPFADEIYKILEELVVEGVLVPKNNYAGGGSEYITYTYEPSEDFDFNEISEEEVTLIDEVMEELSGYGAKTLTDIAYKTEPMVKLGATLGGTENLFKKLNLSA